MKTVTTSKAAATKTTSATKPASRKAPAKKAAKTSKEAVKTVKPTLSKAEQQKALQAAQVAQLQAKGKDVTHVESTIPSKAFYNIANKGAVLYYTSNGYDQLWFNHEAVASWTTAALITAGYISVDFKPLTAKAGALQTFRNLTSYNNTLTGKESKTAFDKWRKLMNADGLSLNVDGLNMLEARLAGKNSGYNINREMVAKFLNHIKTGVKYEENGRKITFFPVRSVG